MYWPGGDRHRGGVNLACGSCRERWKACRKLFWPVGPGEKERSERQIR
jgi:hypothetical protein